MLSEIFKVDNNISEYTPIMRGDEVIGCTVGENKRGYPIKCVLYSHFLSEQDIIGDDDARHVCFLELSQSSEKGEGET